VPSRGEADEASPICNLVCFTSLAINSIKAASILTDRSRRSQAGRKSDPGEAIENQIDPDKETDHPQARRGPLFWARLTTPRFSGRGSLDWLSAFRPLRDDVSVGMPMALWIA
jgi:hypothetical protein